MNKLAILAAVLTSTNAFIGNTSFQKQKDNEAAENQAPEEPTDPEPEAGTTADPEPEDNNSADSMTDAAIVAAEF